MIIHVRTNGTTQFTLYWSRVNSCFIFTRTDVGTNTETSLLTDCQNESEASKYFFERVGFYCDCVGVSLDQLKVG